MRKVKESHTSVAIYEYCNNTQKKQNTEKTTHIKNNTHKKQNTKKTTHIKNNAQKKQRTEKSTLMKNNTTTHIKNTK